MIKVKILADSIGRHNKRLTTFELVYPYFIHAQVMTHRVFSRNAKSYRAIPASKMRTLIRENPDVVEFWGKAQKGMKAYQEIEDTNVAKEWWHKCMENALVLHYEGEQLGIHKEILNRIITPYSHMNTILSATDFGNWEDLRTGHGAQSEIQMLAMEMKLAMDESIPMLLEHGEWHIPLITNEDRESTNNDVASLLKLATARCARVSYLTHNGVRSVEEDLRLHDDLLRDKHLSPFEHSAYCHRYPEYHANYAGFYSYRKMVENNLCSE